MTAKLAEDKFYLFILPRVASGVTVLFSLKLLVMLQPILT